MNTTISDVLICNPGVYIPYKKKIKSGRKKQVCGFQAVPVKTPQTPLTLSLRAPLPFLPTLLLCTNRVRSYCLGSWKPLTNLKPENHFLKCNPRS